MAISKEQSILITGAGGSVGAQLAQRLHATGYEKLILLDRDGSHLHSLELKLLGTGLLTDHRFVLADIRDREAVESVFAKYVPSVVIHTAALKHVPLLERFPAEAWKTNVIGTWNLLETALTHNIGTFLHVSTDKAAEPTTKLGLSKKLAEYLVSAYAQNHRYVLTIDKTESQLEIKSTKPTTISNSLKRRYINVRFGNVIGSRGSVSETFKYQAQNELPLTVTSEEAKRYLMTIGEASDLILESLKTAENGQTVVLKMGEQVKIVDYAVNIKEIYQSVSPIITVGERFGEKLEEILFQENETIATETEKYWFLQARTYVPEIISQLNLQQIHITENYAI